MNILRIKYVFGLGLCIGMLLLSSTTGLACTCELPLSGVALERAVEQARQKSEAVFSGEVIEVIANPGVFYVEVKFKVEQSWKNVRSDELILRTGRGGGDCGYPFKAGERYLVYAYGSGETMLETNICQRTRRLADAEADLKLLGKSNNLNAGRKRKPQQISTPSPCATP